MTTAGNSLVVPKKQIFTECMPQTLLESLQKKKKKKMKTCVSEDSLTDGPSRITHASPGKQRQVASLSPLNDIQMAVCVHTARNSPVIE
jgi:hypothetical protein